MIVRAGAALTRCARSLVAAADTENSTAPVLGTGTPSAQNTARLLPPRRPSVACVLGLPFFCVHRLQHAVLQQRVRQHLFQLRVLPLQFLHPPSLFDVELAKLPLPTVEGNLGDIMLLAHFHDALAAIGFPQDADLLFGRVSFAFHSLGPFYGPQTNIASGLVFGGCPALD